MSPLRDLFLAPRATEARAAPRVRSRVHADARAPTLGVLAPARDLLVVAAAAGLVVGRRAPAALVCLHARGAPPAPAALRAPPRAAATRLVASLGARGVQAEGRGRLVVAVLPDDPDEAAIAATRAHAAAGALPAVLGLAARHHDLDGLLAAQDAILLALPPAVDPTLADLALRGAEALVPSAAAVTLARDPLTRTLALAGVCAPRAIRLAVEGVLA
ncbi:MAG: hypothetical protein QOJ82_3339 [Solirubrobacteraceae bacterium]|nr:hypothetical protein [Solirubrobacteraceae bacterium]